MIEVDDLLGDILTFKPADVGLTAQDTLFAPLSPSEHLSDSCSHALGIVSSNVQAVGAASLFEAAACAGYNGQTATDGLDDGDAKTLVDTGIDKRLGTGI